MIVIFITAFHCVLFYCDLQRAVTCTETPAPIATLPLEYLGKDFPCSHMGVNALAVHSEQVVCNEQKMAACICHSVHSCMRCTHAAADRWPVVTMTMSDLALGILQLHCRLMGSLSYAIYISEWCGTWRMTKSNCHQSRKQSAGSVVLAGQKAQQIQKDPLGFFQSVHFSLVLQRSCCGRP